MVYILRYVTEESNYTPRGKGTMNSQKGNLFKNTVHHIFTSKGEKNKGIQLRINEPYAELIE